MEVSFLIFGSDVKLGGVGDLPTPQLERDSVQTLMIEGLYISGFGLVWSFGSTIYRMYITLSLYCVHFMCIRFVARLRLKILYRGGLDCVLREESPQIL